VTVDSDKVENKNQYMKDNTKKMVERVMELGYRGLREPWCDADSNFTSNNSTYERLTRSRRSLRPFIKKLPTFYNTKSNQNYSFQQKRQFRRDIRRSFNLPCIEIFHSTNTVMEYVFDEPGLEISNSQHQASRLSTQNNTDTITCNISF